jgi:hypothetical protein
MEGGDQRRPLTPCSDIARPDVWHERDSAIWRAAALAVAPEIADNVDAGALGKQRPVQALDGERCANGQSA